MNPTVRIDDRIVKGLKAKKTCSILGNGTMISLVSEALKLFINKNKNCFLCEEHKKVLVGIELAKQKAALIFINNSLESKDTWIGISETELKIAKNLSKYYGGSTKAVVEQAIIEHLVRPDTCNNCSCYDEMCKQAFIINRRLKAN